MSDKSSKPMEDAASAARGAVSSSTEAGADMTRSAMGAFSTMGRSFADQQAQAMKDFSRMFSQLPMPGMPDVEALMAAHRRNMEVLSAANRVALEGAQVVARRHMEIMQQSMSELTESMRALSTPEPPQAKAAKQAELLKAAYERAVNNMRELSDLIQRANGEAVGLLNKRFVEAVDEAKGFIEKAQNQAKQG